MCMKLTCMHIPTHHPHTIKDLLSIKHLTSSWRGPVSQFILEWALYLLSITTMLNHVASRYTHLYIKTCSHTNLLWGGSVGITLHTDSWFLLFPSLSYPPGSFCTTSSCHTSSHCASPPHTILPHQHICHQLYNCDMVQYSTDVNTLQCLLCCRCYSHTIPRDLFTLKYR